MGLTAVKILSIPSPEQMNGRHREHGVSVSAITSEPARYDHTIIIIIIIIIVYSNLNHHLSVLWAKSHSKTEEVGLLQA